ncbi:MAG: hypothetical protein ACREEW_14775 [Caulobacteraceae bacterium]
MPEQDKTPAKREPKSFLSGEEGPYRTDTFSRGDREGLPGPEEVAGDDSAGNSSVEATPDADAESLKPVDDADSRDATPPSAAEGGVR